MASAFPPAWPTDGPRAPADRTAAVAVSHREITLPGAAGPHVGRTPDALGRRGGACLRMRGHRAAALGNRELLSEEQVQVLHQASVAASECSQRSADEKG